MKGSKIFIEGIRVVGHWLLLAVISNLLRYWGWVAVIGWSRCKIRHYQSANSRC